MHKRRSVIKSLACAAAGVALGGDRVLHRPFLAASDEVVTKRPAPEQRRFVSDAVEAKIVEVKRAIADPELAWLFENCFPTTLDTTVTFSTEHNRPDTYVITGDINAMWLRDSTAQVTPYLPLAREDRKLKDMIAGVINRQTRCILIDPYATRSTSARRPARGARTTSPQSAPSCASASGRSTQRGSARGRLCADSRGMCEDLKTAHPQHLNGLCQQ